MKYKMLVLDVDGTLLNDEKEISKRTLTTLLKVQQMGVRIMLASGRPTYGLLPLAKKLELGTYNGYILSYNGGQVINASNGEVVFERRINPEHITYLEKKAEKNGFSILTYNGDTVVTNNPNDPHVQAEAALNGMKVEHQEFFSAAIDYPPCKCMLVSDDEEALVGLENHWKRRLNGVLDVFRTVFPGSGGQPGGQSQYVGRHHGNGGHQDGRDCGVRRWRGRRDHVAIG